MGSVNQSLSWEERVAQKKKERADRIPPAWRISETYLNDYQIPLSEHKNNLIQTEAIRKSGVLTTRELEITEQYHVSGLLSALADGRLTSAEVTLAYCKRAAVSQQLVRCLSSL